VRAIVSGLPRILSFAEADAYLERFLNLLHGRGIDRAQSLDEPAAIDCTDLIEKRNRCNRKPCRRIS
jgi:hypothetical protein